MKLLECTGCRGLVSANTDFCSACGTRIERTSKPWILRITALVILLPMAFFGVVTFGDGNQSASKARLEKIAVPILSHGEIAGAIKDIREKIEVVDARIHQEEQNISVVLVVNDDTSKQMAEKLGNHFVSEIFVLSDTRPGDAGTLEKGRFNYLIGIYTPNQRRIAVGSKRQGDTKISW